jgi:hypothetical protein
LDFFEGVGGFLEAITIIVFTIGEFFSARFFTISIASTFYKIQKSDDQL